MDIFPTDAVTTVTSGVTGFLSANIAVVLGIMAFMVGLGLVLKLTRKATHGKI